MLTYPDRVPAADSEARAASAAARADRRRARTRGAILDAAEAVFGREGYETARLEEIAEAADMSVGSIYTHFDGKRGVYLHLVERALVLFADYMERSDDPSMTPLQRVLAGGDAYLKFHLEHPGAFHFLAYRNPGVIRLSDDDVEARIRDRIGDCSAASPGRSTRRSKRARRARSTRCD